MFRYAGILLLLVMFGMPTAFGQELKVRPKAVVVPGDIYLPTIVAQPDCPLQIEKAVIAKMLDGTQREFFQARNVGKKPIVFFQVAKWYSDNAGLNAIWPYKRSQVSVPPGAMAPSTLNDGSVEFVPLTDPLKKTLKLEGKMRGIVFFMVFKIEFEDGTVYDATPLFDALQEHLKLFESLYDKTASRPNKP
jgi:hypothetical protein